MLIRNLRRLANRVLRRPGTAPWKRPAPPFRPRLEQLEDRVTPSITLTNAFLVNYDDQPVTALDKGEEVFIQANWNTQGLPSDASYRVRFSVDGVTLSTDYLNFGAGASDSQDWQWYLGGWYAAPGTHNVTVTIDPTTYGTTSQSFSFTPVTAADLPHKFINPIGGTPFQNWDIITYTDVDPRPGNAVDYAGGGITQPGENGHDLAITNFTAMDAGVPVVAAADGTVTDVQDGNFDRNTVAIYGTPANYVVVDHGNGWRTWYYHLRNDSILVHVGDHVTAGQVLGLVGSSGQSAAAHLDFGVWHNDDVVEPFYDPNTYWANPVPYQGTVRDVIDSGVTQSIDTTFQDLSAFERPVDANVVTQAGGTFVPWFRGATVAGDTITFKLYKPDGSLDAPYTYSFTAPFTGGNYRTYIYEYLLSGLDLGTWHVGIEINGVEMARDAFQVTTAGAAAARVSQGSTYVPNGRTTPIDFGTVAPAATPPQKTFTVTNTGSATLTLSNLVLPAGYSLVGSMPSSIAVGSSATFTVQMATGSSGTDAGVLSFSTNAPNAPTYSFNLKGVVSGGNTGEVHGQVFHDLNGDGIENGADAGLAGWTVSLLNPADSSVLATTITGNNGYYALYNLAPGTYRVRVTLQSGYQLTNPDPADVTVGTADVLASPIGVGVPAATHFLIGTPPSVTAGAPFSITVTAADARNHTVTGYTGTVHFSSADPHGAGLPVDYTFSPADAGTHAFATGGTLFTAGTWDVTATDSSSGITGSASVAVTPAAAHHLLFVQQPTDTPAGGTISTVIVAIVDQYGNVETGDNSDTVTLSIGVDPSGGTATLSGTLTVTVVNGVATFSDLAIDTSGAGYTLHASVGSVPDLDSNPFNIL
jgi:murein DD-endopeptidase MepM/ murein hydrolase activator NlpD